MSGGFPYNTKVSILKKRLRQYRNLPEPIQPPAKFFYRARSRWVTPRYLPVHSASYKQFRRSLTALTRFWGAGNKRADPSTMYHARWYEARKHRRKNWERREQAIRGEN